MVNNIDQLLDDINDIVSEAEVDFPAGREAGPRVCIDTDAVRALLVATFENLLRENERLSADVEREAELATHMANDCNDAQSKVKRLRESLLKISDGYGPNHMSAFCRGIARTALASTGGEYHGN